jgi:sulfur carrier protein
MRIFVNDAELDLPSPATVSDLLARLDIASTRVAVEVNRQLVRRAEHPTKPLEDGDRIEVVTLVGGG